MWLKRLRSPFIGFGSDALSVCVCPARTYVRPCVCARVCVLNDNEDVHQLSLFIL